MYQRLVWFSPQDFIKQHNHTRYCEALISKEGLVAYAVPSHQQAALNTTGLTIEEARTLIPSSASPMHWALEYSEMIAVWFNSIIFIPSISEKAKESLKLLTINKVIEPISVHCSYEKTTCEHFANNAITELFSLREKANNLEKELLKYLWL